MENGIHNWNDCSNITDIDLKTLKDSKDFKKIIIKIIMEEPDYT